MKKYLSILMTLMLMFGMVSMLGACSNDNAAAEEVPEELIEETGGDEDTISSEEELVALETDRQLNSPGFFLTRKGEDFDLLYSLDNEFYPLEPSDQVGFTIQDDLGDKICTLYSLISVFNNGKPGFNTHGHVPILTLQPEDRILSVFEREIPKLRLYEVEFYGNTIDIRFAGAAELYLSNSLHEGARDVQVEDENGNVCDDWYNLDADRTYTVSWYEGSYTDIHKEEMISNCKAYTFKSDIDSNNIYASYDYEIDGKDSGMEKTAEYNLTDIPAGLYRIGNSENGIFGGMIRIE